MLTPNVEAEIGELAAGYGSPRRWRREYRIASDKDAEWVRRMMRRRGEVILIVPRPDGRVLLHTKQFYPASVFRLPSGGIRRDERVLDAAQREAYEELGFNIPIARFLGVLENEFIVDGETLTYPSFIFQTEPLTDSPQVIDPDEEITAFLEVSVEELKNIAESLVALPREWEMWGRFRAAPHLLAKDALMSNEQ